MSYVLDAGALIAHERGNLDLRRRLAAAVRYERDVRVPAVVIAQVWRDGARQVLLGRLLASATVVEVDDDLARRAGELLARTGTQDAVDAIVACVAARADAVVLTSDASDLQVLADDLGGVRVVVV